MCGIAGQLRWDTDADTCTVETMTMRLQHRGPDAHGLKTVGPASFGHTRLAIIDLSPGGAQPMLSAAGDLMITFNGEIYNFKEIKADLVSRGVQFRSNSDTEVILEAYRAWGTSCVTRFNGMFAFAVWDNARQTLFAARDRLGKKPFYYYLDSASFSFASELPALLADQRIPDEVNQRAIVQFLALGYLTTAECANPHVRRLPPGHILVWTRGSSPTISQYWNLAEKFASKRSYARLEDAVEEHNLLLADAVKIRLMSDVPLGAFLSGGIDSSTVTAHMLRFQAPAACHTFSAGFHEPSFNELDSARSVAQFLGVTHHEETVDSSVPELLADINTRCGEPFADTSIIPMYLLSRFARKHVTVALSGDGADEIFGGYETYLADKFHRYLHRIPAPLVRALRSLYVKSTTRDFGKVSRDYKVLQFLRGLSLPYAHAHFSWRELFTRDEIYHMVRPELRGIVDESHPIHQFVRFDDEVSSSHYLDRSMYVDIKTWLVDDILVKVDRASMAHALEARSPFLDYRLVEFAAQLPVNFKVRGLSKKHILKESQRGVLPPSVLKRPKSGFNAPISIWLFETLRDICKDMATNSPLLAYVEPAVIQRTIDEHLSRRQDNSFKIFALLQLHLFLLNRNKLWLRKAA